MKALKHSPKMALSIPVIVGLSCALVCPMCYGQLQGSTNSLLERAERKQLSQALGPAANMPMPLVAPLFIEDRDFTSSLVLVNGSDVHTYADVVLRALDGGQITRRRVQLDPYGQSRVDVGSMLRSAGSSASTGSITVTQSPDLQGMAVAAQLSMNFVKYPQPSYIDEEVAMPSPHGSQILRAAANNVDGSPLIAITSLSASTQHIRVECLMSPHFSKSVELAAGETLVTEACTDATDHATDFQTVQERASESPGHPVGIALLTDAMPGSFAAFGLGSHRTKDQQFWSSISFADPMMIVSATSVFAGVPIGPATLLPEGRYLPEVALSNFSNAPAHVRILYATTQATARVREIRRVLIPPASSRLITLNDLDGDPGLRNSFLILSDQPPGSVMANLVSTSNSRLREVELLGKDEKDPQNGGNHPWNLEQGNESTLLLFNHSSKPQLFNVLISAGGKPWQKTYTLKPMQTEAISIRTLIENGIQDDAGRTLPDDGLSGVVRWFVSEPGHGKGRLMQSNSDLAMARNFSCAAYNVLCGASISPTSTSLNVGASATFSGTAHICIGYNSTACSGTASGTGSSDINSWSGARDVLNYTCSGVPVWSATGNASGTGNITYQAQSYTGCVFSASSTVTVKPVINSISPGHGPAGTTVGVTIAGAGFGAASTVSAGTGITITYSSRSNTSISANFVIASNAPAGNHAVTVTAGGQTSTSVNFSVQIPYQVEPINTQIQGAAVCPAGQHGWSRTVTNQLQTSSGVAIQTSGITMADTISIQTPNGLGVSGTVTGSHPTDSSGNFPDTYFVCSTACPGSGTASATQSWTYNSLGLTHRNAVSYTCSAITVDGH